MKDKLFDNIDKDPLIDAFLNCPPHANWEGFKNEVRRLDRSIIIELGIARLIKVKHSDFVFQRVKIPSSSSPWTEVIQLGLRARQDYSLIPSFISTGIFSPDLPAEPIKASKDSKNSKEEEYEKVLNWYQNEAAPHLAVISKGVYHPSDNDKTVIQLPKLVYTPNSSTVLSYQPSDSQYVMDDPVLHQKWMNLVESYPMEEVEDIWRKFGGRVLLEETKSENQNLHSFDLDVNIDEWLPVQLDQWSKFSKKKITVNPIRLAGIFKSVMTRRPWLIPYSTLFVLLVNDNVTSAFSSYRQKEPQETWVSFQAQYRHEAFKKVFCRWVVDEGFVYNPIVSVSLHPHKPKREVHKNRKQDNYAHIHANQVVKLMDEVEQLIVTVSGTIRDAQKKNAVLDKATIDYCEETYKNLSNRWNWIHSRHETQFRPEFTRPVYDKLKVLESVMDDLREKFATYMEFCGRTMDEFEQIVKMDVRATDVFERLKSLAPIVEPIALNKIEHLVEARRPLHFFCSQAIREQTIKKIMSHKCTSIPMRPIEMLNLACYVNHHEELARGRVTLPPKPLKAGQAIQIDDEKLKYGPRLNAHVIDQRKTMSKEEFEDYIYHLHHRIGGGK